MKNILIFLVLITATALAKSQHLDRQLVASGGGYQLTEEISVSFTVGDLAILALQSEGINLSQGFQQGELFSPTYVNSRVRLRFEVYPNPTKDLVWLTLDQTAQHENILYSIRIYSTDGQEVLHKNTKSGAGANLLDLGNLMPGTYFIRITGPAGEAGNFPVVKL